MQTVSSKCQKKRFGIFKNTPFVQQPLIKQIPLHFQFKKFEGFVLDHARNEFKSKQPKNNQSHHISDRSLKAFDHRNKIFGCSRCKGTGTIDCSLIQNRRSISTSKRDRKSLIFNNTRSNSIRNSIQPSEIEEGQYSVDNNENKFIMMKNFEKKISKTGEFLRQKEFKQKDNINEQIIQINAINSEISTNKNIMDPIQFYELIKEIRSSKRATRNTNHRTKHEFQHQMKPSCEQSKENLEYVLDRQKWIYKI